MPFFLSSLLLVTYVDITSALKSSHSNSFSRLCSYKSFILVFSPPCNGEFSLKQAYIYNVCRNQYESSNATDGLAQPIGRTESRTGSIELFLPPSVQHEKCMKLKKHCSYVSIELQLILDVYREIASKSYSAQE